MEQIKMSDQSSELVQFDVKRPTTSYHPSIWGDHFLNYASKSVTIDSTIEEEFERLKEEVRRMLISTTDKAFDMLCLIDTVQRFGVAYHFEREIEDALKKLSHDDYCNTDEDLYTVSLRFRLLRQQGFNVSCDIFSKFRDDKGKFLVSIIHDVRGMLSLYEAAHLGIRGEDVLDDAIAFTTAHLVSSRVTTTPELEEHITHALNRPLRKGLPRLEARYYIDKYTESFRGDDVDSKKKNLLHKFAKLDFNMLQAQHQKELGSITKWWKDIDVETKLPYARDRVVECYFWIMGVYFEPQYSFARRILSKVIATASILDDTYDAYATYEELVVFTDAVIRWDVRTMDGLPEYMKLVYQKLLDVYSEAEEEVKRLVQAYLMEAKWCKEEYVPTTEEYLSISLITTTYHMLATTSFIGMGEIANKKAFDWISNDTPKIVRASEIICRLMDDIVSHKFEQKREHVATGIECYMKQHGVYDEEEVIKIFRNEIHNSWKDINEECLMPTDVAMPLLVRILNLVRVMDVIYKDVDGYTDCHVLKAHITSLLLDPIPHS